jgi:hypothetical protein
MPGWDAGMPKMVLDIHRAICHNSLVGANADRMIRENQQNG